MAGCGIVLYFANAPKTFLRGSGCLSWSRRPTAASAAVTV